MAATGPVPPLPVPDPLKVLPPGSVKPRGYIDDRIQRQSDVSFDAATLAATVDAFRSRQNGFADCEFWGKAVRALCHHYQYGQNPRLKNCSM